MERKGLRPKSTLKQMERTNTFPIWQIAFFCSPTILKATLLLYNGAVARRNKVGKLFGEIEEKKSQ